MQRGQERKRLKEQRQASGAEGRGTSAGAGTGAEAIKGAERGQRGRKAAGERAPEVTENDVVLPRKGSIQVRQCPRAACSPATPLRQLPPPLRRGAIPSAHRPAVYYHSALPLRQLSPFAPPRATPSRYPPPPLTPYLCQLPLACTTTRPVSAPLRPLLLFRKGRRCPPQGRAPAPIAQIRTTDPSPEHAQKRAASAAGCRPMERMRRLYSRSSPVSSATGGS